MEVFVVSKQRRVVGRVKENLHALLKLLKVNVTNSKSVKVLESLEQVEAGHVG